MDINLTYGQMVALSDFFGYKIVAGDSAYIDTDKNQVIFFGPTCPIDHKLPEHARLVEDFSKGEDHWKVEVWSQEEKHWILGI